MDRFQKLLREHKKLNPEQRKAFLEGMLASIDVELVEAKTHKLTINFELPVVDDSIEYLDPKKKEKGYRLKEGERSLPILSNIRQYSKKKQVQQGT